MTRRQLKRFFQECSSRRCLAAKYSSDRPFLCTHDRRIYATDGRICVRTRHEADWAEAIESAPPVHLLPWEPLLYRKPPIQMIPAMIADDEVRIEKITLAARYAMLLSVAGIRDLHPSLENPLVSALYFQTRQCEGLVMPKGLK